MIRRSPVLGILLMLSAATIAAEEKYGAGVTLKEATPIERLLATPDEYLGKTVRVDGRVEAVCDMMGCWMNLSEAASGKTIQVKVDDGVIVFPVAAKGRSASAEGVFEKVTPETAEHATDAAKDQSGQTGHDAEHARQAAMKYRIKATGAIVR
jgi:hypothetical protein